MDIWEKYKKLTKTQKYEKIIWEMCYVPRTYNDINVEIPIDKGNLHGILDKMIKDGRIEVCEEKRGASGKVLSKKFIRKGAKIIKW